MRRASVPTRAVLRGLAATGAVVALLSVSGCTGRPGAAAVVDGRTITGAEVESATTQLTTLLQGVSTTTVLAVLVQEPVVTALAADHGVAVSDQQARDTLDQAVEQAGGEPVDFSDASVAVGRYLVAANALQALTDGTDVQTELGERIAAQDVEVNPRYGTVDDTNAVVEPAALPWLVEAPAES